VAIAYLTRSVQFRATHHYARPEWSAERNRAAFGASSTPHAHAYECLVTVRGAVEPATGMAADLGTLDRILAEEVVARLDQRDLNADVPEFAAGRAVPTGEELCLDIWRRVAPRLPAGCALAAVRVQESPTLFSEYRGEG
jgi:6-pyruvoyltetrahydropterin/6-carboxytetrahydropterin synthase